MADLPPGTVVGPYRVLSVLGRGGMGVVYEAEDTGLRRRVALKVLAQDLARDEAFMARFRREAKSMAAVSHPNVASVHETGAERGVPWLAAELVPGGTLAARIEKGALDSREAARIGAEIAWALGAIHAAGLVHRDIKPANVLLDEKGTAKLSDFGLARSMTPGAQTRLTKTGELVGTFEYLAPEHADGAAAAGPSADLYALGGTIFAMLTGRPPFEGSGIALVTAHLRTRPRAPSSLAPGVPPALDALVLRLLEKEPGARPASAGEVALALESVASAKAPARRVVLPLLLLLAVGVGVGIAAFVPRGETPAPPRPAPAPPPPPRTAPRVSAKRLWIGNTLRKSDHCAISRDGSYVAACGGPEAGWLELWRAEQGALPRAQMRNAMAHDQPAWRCQFTPSGRFVISGGYDGLLKIWETAKMGVGGADGFRFALGVPAGRVTALAVSEEGILAGFDDGHVAFYRRGSDETTFDEPRPYELGKVAVAGVAFAGGGRAVGSAGAKVFVFDLDGRARPAETNTGRDSVFSVAVAKGLLLSAGTLPPVADVWELDGLKHRAQLAGHKDAIRIVAFARDGALALTGSHDGTVRVWDTATWKTVATLELGPPIGGVAVSADGRRVAVSTGGGATGTVSLWELDLE